jgi:hypothetical protein
MGFASRIEIDISALLTNPTIADMITANLTKTLFKSGYLILPQFPGWYVAEPIVFEPIVSTGAATWQVAQGDRYYTFAAKAEAFRSAEIEQVLSLLAPSVTLRDYCYLGGGGSLATDGDGNQYKTRTGRLTLYPAQSPALSDGRVSHFEPMDLRFDEF